MSIETLDKYFPWVVFFYGFLLVLVLESPLLLSRARALKPSMVQWLEPRRKLAWVCVFVGGLWSLQNLWL